MWKYMEKRVHKQPPYVVIMLHASHVHISKETARVTSLLAILGKYTHEQNAASSRQRSTEKPQPERFTNILQMHLEGKNCLRLIIKTDDFLWNSHS
jgi:hypothetical protein